MARLAQEGTGYSADVELWIDCGPLGRFPLSQASSTFVVAAEPLTIPPCDAQIILVVDGKRYARPVTLPAGVTEGSREAVVLSRDGVAPF